MLFAIFVVFVLITMVVTGVVVFLSFSVIADAGIFFVVAAGAIIEVDVEAGAGFLSVRLDADDGGNVVAGREGFFGEKTGGGLLEGKLDRGASFSSDEGDFLVAGSDGLVVLVEEGDLDFAVLGDEELGVRFYFGEDASSVGTCFLGVGMIVMIFVLITVIMSGVLGMVVCFLGLLREGEG